MKPLIISLLSLILIFIGSCSESVNCEGIVEKEFQILDTKGQPKTIFASEDTIVFLYSLHNRTGNDINIGMAHGGPLVRFLILLDSIIIKDSFEGYGFRSDAPSYPLPNNDTIDEEWIYEFNSIAKGIYTAKAVPEMFVENEGIPPEKDLEFVIN